MVTDYTKPDPRWFNADARREELESLKAKRRHVVGAARKHVETELEKDADR